MSGGGAAPAYAVRRSRRRTLALEVLRDGRVLKAAHILQPQVTEVSLILGREAACPAAVASAITAAQMVTSVAQACDREGEDGEVEAID